MARIKPFACIRPDSKLAGRVAALPYDVYSREEAKEEIEKEPLSFLKIDRAETQFDSSVDTYDSCVYDKANELLSKMIEDKILIRDDKPCYYVYELIMDGRSQIGITACAFIDDYQNHIIKKHEDTREEKEIDRIKHVDKCNAQTGPIFLAYPNSNVIDHLVNHIKNSTPLYHFIAVDGIEHNVWRVENKQTIDEIERAFTSINSIYIADGHHRAASAVKVGLHRREEQGDYDGTEEFNYFLSVLFPDNQLKILPYHRVVTDLNGNSKEEFLDKVRDNFIVTLMGVSQFSPLKKGEFGMYLEDNWYKIQLKEKLKEKKDCVGSLDVSLLQDYLLSPILGIEDPRTDKRIDFIGGIRGLKELEKRVKEDMKVAFSMYPTSIGELFLVAEEGKLMPPKSTWFEPKLRSGLFIHNIRKAKV